MGKFILRLFANIKLAITKDVILKVTIKINPKNNIAYPLVILYYVFLIISQSTLGAISHNVLAVCDGFAVAIKKREAFQQPQNCGGAKHHKGL